MKRYLKDILAVLALGVIVLVFFWPGFSTKRVFFGADEIASDLVHLVYTHNAFIYGFLADWHIPLWNPYAGSGSPLMGEAQTGIYSPVQVLLYLLFKPPLAFNLLIISAFLIAAVGTYLYARCVGLWRQPAIFSAISFAFCGFMVGQVRHISIIDAVAFMPLMFLVCEKIIRNPRLIWMSILATLIYLSFAPGHLTSTYLLIFMLIVYFLARLWLVFGSEREESMRPVVIFSAGLVLGIIASAGTILPALEMVKYSSRATFSLESSLNPIYKFKYLLMFLSPFVFGDPSRGTWDLRVESFWENIGYVGILPLILAILAGIWGVRVKNRYILVFVFFIALNFILVFGNSTFLYSLARDWIPGFSFTRVPGRFLLYIDFFLSILAGFGLEIGLSRLKSSKRQKAGLVIILLTLIDLFSFGFGFNSFMPTSYFEKPNSAKFLKQDPGIFRIRQIGFEGAWQDAWVNSGGWRGDLTAYFNQKQLLPPDYNMVFGISTPAFLYGMAGRYGVKRSIELDELVASSLNDTGVSKAPLLLGMENVKYLLLPKDTVWAEGFEKVADLPNETSEGRVFIFRNKSWMPRAYMVGKAVEIQPASIPEAMIFSDFDPTKEVILEKKIDKVETQGGGSVVIDSYRDNRVDLSADSREGGFLVLSDTFYPGWKARIDGRETEIFQANYAYRAIYLEKGKHKVVFSFEPLSVRVGGIVTFGSLFIIFGFFIWDIKFSRSGKFR